MQKTKIKSQWKAQKRKEGLVSSRPPGERDRLDEEKGEEGNDDADDEKEFEAEKPESPRTSSFHKGKGKDIPRTILSVSPSGKDGKHRRKYNDIEKQNDDSGASNSSQIQSKEQAQSLRELTSKAYSPSSLHHYKSDPLHRRKDAVKGYHANSDARGTNAGRGRGGRDGKSRGGQPDMKLRMSAMLAKIQRDLT